jgi:hypothetical protein
VEFDFASTSIRNINLIRERYRNNVVKMRFDMVSGASALLWLIAGVEASKHAHLHHLRHEHGAIHSVAEVGAPLEKRGGKCEFPSDAGLVAVTPNMKNAGWAMSPDQACEPGNYCPYACPPGQVSMQWDPKATSYSYPLSMVSFPSAGSRR